MKTDQQSINIDCLHDIRNGNTMSTLCHHYLEGWDVVGVSC